MDSNQSKKPFETYLALWNESSGRDLEDASKKVPNNSISSLYLYRRFRMYTHIER